MISELDALAVLQAFDAAFGRPYMADDAKRATLWKRALHDVDLDEVRYAVHRLTLDAEKYPTPKQVRTVAFHLRTRKRLEARAEAEQHDQPLPFCSRCNAQTLIEDVWGRYRPRHADNCPGLHASDLEVQRISLASARVTPHNNPPTGETP